MSDDDFFNSDSEDELEKENEDSIEEPKVIQKNEPKVSQKSENTQTMDKPIPLSKISFLTNVDGEKDLLDDGVSFKCLFKNRVVALKPVHSIPGCEKFDKEQEEIFRKEKSALLKELIHENVLKYYGFCYLEGNMCIIFEHIEGGKPLFQFLKEVREGEIKVSSEEKVHIVSDIAKTVEYLQKNSKLEREINPWNVTLSLRERKHGRWCAKISVLGVPEPSYKSKQSTIGASAYIAPELLSPREFFRQEPIYTEHCDSYSVGVLIWCILTGYLPNVHRNHLNYSLESSNEDYYIKKLKVYSKNHASYEPDSRSSIGSLIKNTDLLRWRMTRGGYIRKLRVRSTREQCVKTFEQIPIRISNEELLEILGKAFGTENPNMCQLRLKGGYFISLIDPPKNLEKFMKKTSESNKLVKGIFIPLAKGTKQGADEMTTALRCKGIQISPLFLENLILLDESKYAQFHEKGKWRRWEFMKYTKKVSLAGGDCVELLGDPVKAKNICNCFVGKRTDMYIFEGKFESIRKIPEYHDVLKSTERSKSRRQEHFEKVKEDENIVGAAFYADDDFKTPFSLKIGGLVEGQTYTLLIQSYNYYEDLLRGVSLIIEFRT